MSRNINAAGFNIIAPICTLRSLVSNEYVGLRWRRQFSSDVRVKLRKTKTAEDMQLCIIWSPIEKHSEWTLTTKKMCRRAINEINHCLERKNPEFWRQIRIVN